MTAREILPGRIGADLIIQVPGSKSLTNRALLLAALADGRSRLENVLVADDTIAFADGLRSLGFTVEAAGDAWLVEGRAGRVPAAAASVWCAEAGTAARFLPALCAASDGRYAFDGGDQLKRRPMGPLLDALRAQGAVTEPAAADRLPFELQGRGLAGGFLELPGSVSSQFVSALLMVAPLARGPLEIAVRDLVSKPYVDMTLAMMERFGVVASRDGSARFRVEPSVYRPRDEQIEPDASTASYFFAAAALTGGRVTIPGLRRHDALQGDIRFLDALEAMGCGVHDAPEGTTLSAPGTLCDAVPCLNGLTIDMGDISDTFMTLAALAPFATSPVTITGIGNVRLKESDRIAAMEDNLRRLGVHTEAGEDYLRVTPGVPTGGRVDPHGDHRIAMSLSVLGLRTPGVVIDDPDCVAKTCPQFFDLWTRLEQPQG